jgi:Na+/proline symporter
MSYLLVIVVYSAAQIALGIRCWVGALGLAAVFSAEVSAADAVLFMVATSLSQDLYKRVPQAGGH